MIQGAPVNALDYGASPSASAAVNTVAIQAALNSGALQVYLPAGTYSISAVLTVPTYVEFFGAGQQATIIQQTVAGQGGVSVTSTSYSKIRGMTVTSNAVTPTQSGLYFSGCGNAIVSDVLVSSFSKGIEILASQVQIQRAYVTTCTSHGIHLRSTGTAGVDVEIVDSSSQANTGDGLRISGLQSGHYIKTLQTSLNGGSGLYMETDATGSPSDIHFIQLISDTNSVHGIFVGSTVNSIRFVDCWSANRGSGYNWRVEGTDISIIGGKVRSCYGHGIQFITGTRGVVTGTVIESASQDGIDTYDGLNIASTNVSVTGVSTFDGNNKMRYGIKLEVGASNVSVVGGNVSGHLGNVLDSSGVTTNSFVGVTGIPNSVPQISTAAGLVSTTSGVAATLFTIANVAGLYQVFAYALATGSSANWCASATVVCNADGTLKITAINGGNLTLTASGMNIQATQAVGIVGISYSYLKIV